MAEEKRWSDLEKNFIDAAVAFQGGFLDLGSACLVTYHKIDLPLFNAVCRILATPDDYDYIFTTCIDTYQAINAVPRVLVTPSSKPVDLPQVLEARGFRPMADPPKMYGYYSDQPPTVSPGTPVNEFLAEDIEGFTRCFLAGRGIPEDRLADWAETFAFGYNDPGTKFFWAKDGDTVIGTITTFTKGGVTGLYWTSVRPEYHGKGIYESLLSSALSGAFQRKSKVIGTMVDADAEEIPALEKIGFKQPYELKYYELRE